MTRPVDLTPTATGELTAVAPFDFAHTLTFVRHFSDEQRVSAGALVKAIRYAGQTYAFRVESTGTVDEPRLRYTLYGTGPIAPGVQAALADRIRFFLSLDDDLRPLYALAADDPAFQPIVEALYGYHQVKFLTPFENACWAILTTRNRLSAAEVVKRQIMERWGGVAAVEGARLPAFPEPVDLLSAAPDALAALVGQVRRAAYLREAAQAFALVDEGWLRNGEYDAVRDWLLAIRGIGPWAASFILIRSLGRMQRLVVPETRLISAASRFYGRPLNAEDVLALAQQYGPQQAYWAHYVRAAGS